MNTTSKATTTSNEKTFKVSLGGDEKTLPQSEVMAYAEELHKKHGGVPNISEVSVAPVAAPPSAPTVTLTSVQPIAPAPVREGEIDQTAKARIDAQQAVLREAGITGIGYKGEGGDGEQFFANGTRMMGMGYATQAARKAEHENAMPIDQAAAGLSDVIKAEGREDMECTAREFAKAIKVNGKLTVFDKTLTEQAIRGLMGRTESPALSYLLGLRNRILTEMAKPESSEDPEVEIRNITAMRADRMKIAEILYHEAMRQGDMTLKLRTRKSPGDIFACVSPGFAAADAPEVCAQILGSMPKGAKGTWTYHPESTSWELRADVWTPTPIDQQAVGEPFAGYVSFRARDNGTSRFRGGGGIEILRCLNASVYVADGATVDRVHRGKILYDIAAMMNGALLAINVLCRAWGTTREQVVALPVVDDKPVPIEVAIPGFWRSLLRDSRSELQGVLPGRSKAHVEGLTKAYFGERRDPNRIVRSDFGQAWTRYSQSLPVPVQRDAETAISDWLMSPRTAIRCDLADA
jgi:hypothetical protein